MRVLFFLLLISSITSFSQQVVPNDWRLSSKQAKAMTQFYAECKGDCFESTATPDTSKENLIRSVYPHAKSFTWLNARYRSEDVDRYASRNWQRARAGGTQVAGYTTRILRVVDSDNTTYFFDIASICPPPALCDAKLTDQEP